MSRIAAFVGLLTLIAMSLLLAEPADATCGEQCDGDYASAIDDCRSQSGEDPADADELATCIQSVRDDYRSCLDSCAADATPAPRRPSANLLARLHILLAANARALSAEDAAKHVGETATVCGVVASAHYAASSRAQPTFLNFDKVPQLERQ